MVKKSILITLLLLTSLIASSQVTIGLEEVPAEGALLQLKNQSITAQNANSTKGLLLPRVNFDPVGSATGTTAQKLVVSLKLVLPSGTVVDETTHVGLMVYNVVTQTVSSTNAPFAETKICPGVYVWNGTQWVRTMFKECQ